MHFNAKGWAYSFGVLFDGRGRDRYVQRLSAVGSGNVAGLRTGRHRVFVGIRAKIKDDSFNAAIAKGFLSAALHKSNFCSINIHATDFTVHRYRTERTSTKTYLLAFLHLRLFFPPSCS